MSIKRANKKRSARSLARGECARRRQGSRFCCHRSRCAVGTGPGEEPAVCWEPGAHAQLGKAWTKDGKDRLRERGGLQLCPRGRPREHRGCRGRKAPRWLIHGRRLGISAPSRRRSGPFEPPRSVAALLSGSCQVTMRHFLTHRYV